MARWVVLAVLMGCVGFGLAQSGPTVRTLTVETQELAAHVGQRDPMWAAQIDEEVKKASLEEIGRNLPTLIADTESADARVRGDALLLVFAIGQRQKTGLPENQRTLDVAADALIVPYISRLAPRLMDLASQNRGLAVLIFSSLVAVRPVPPELLATALNGLLDPRSTEQPVDTTGKFPDHRAPSPGPQMLWIVIPASSTFHVDGTSGIAEGEYSVAAQEAIIRFLRRRDQTRESRVESIRALALAQAQSWRVNAELLRWLDGSDSVVKVTLLRNLSKLTLSAEDFNSAKARVALLAGDPAATAEVRKTAAEILPCWTNDRHHGLCSGG